MDVTSSVKSYASAVTAPPEVPLKLSATNAMDTSAPAEVSLLVGTNGSAQQAAIHGFYASARMETGTNSPTCAKQTDPKKTLVGAVRRLRASTDVVPRYQLSQKTPPKSNHESILREGTGFVPPPPVKIRKRPAKQQRRHPLSPQSQERSEDEAKEEHEGVGAMVAELREELRRLRAEMRDLRRNGLPLRNTTGPSRSERLGLVSRAVQTSQTRSVSASTEPSAPCSSCAPSGSISGAAPVRMEVDDEEMEWEDAVESQGPDGKPEPEAPTPAGVEEKPQDAQAAVDFMALVDEFEEWIYMKTQMQKRDSAFVKMLGGLTQRWIRSKKLERTPRPFIDCLTKACIERVKPSEVEVSLADEMQDPDARCAMERLNDATRGEVHIFNQTEVNRWCDYHASRLSKWVVTFPVSAITGWWPEGHWKVPCPSWGAIFVWTLMLVGWTYLAPAVGVASDCYFDLPFPNVVWTYGSMPYVPRDQPIRWVMFTALGVLLQVLTWMKYITWVVGIRKAVYRCLYYWPEYVSPNLWRDPMGRLRVFGPGNGRSQ